MDLPMSAGEDRHALHAAFEARHGFWGPGQEALLELDPRYFREYDKLLGVVRERGNLSDLECALISVAVNVQPTHMNLGETEAAMRQAKRAGATEAQIMETVELASSLGVHSMIIGAPLLEEALRGSDAISDAPQSDKHDARSKEALKDRFLRDRKYWSEAWDVILDMSPEYFEAYLDMSSVPWNHGVLEDSFRELIYVAIDVVTTHLFVSGISLHARKAIDYGATPAQVVDVMTLASALGLQTTLSGAAVLRSLREE